MYSTIFLKGLLRRTDVTGEHENVAGNWFSQHEKCPYSGYSGLYFPAFGLNSDQNNSEYGHFLRSVYHNKQTLQSLKEVIKCNKVKDEFPVFLMVG